MGRFTMQNWNDTCVCAELYLSTNLKHLKVSYVKFMYENVHMTLSTKVDNFTCVSFFVILSFIEHGTKPQKQGKNYIQSFQ